MPRVYESYPTVWTGRQGQRLRGRTRHVVTCDRANVLGTDAIRPREFGLEGPVPEEVQQITNMKKRRVTSTMHPEPDPLKLARTLLAITSEDSWACCVSSGPSR
jgi:hypothetical protein